MALYTFVARPSSAFEPLQDAFAAWEEGRRPLPLRVDPADPWLAALAGLWAVLAAEHPERLPTVSVVERVRAVEPALNAVGFSVVAGTGALSAFVRSAVPDRGGATVVPIDPPPDAPLRDVSAALVRQLVRSTVERLDASSRPLLVTTSEHLTGRPLGGPAAIVAGAATGWARCHGVPVLHVGPWGDGPTRHGVSPIDAAALRAGLRTAWSVGRVWAVDAAWPEVVRTFPHLRALAADLLRAELQSVVREEVGRRLGRGEPPLDRPLRDLGLDSLGWEEVRARLEERLGVAVPSRLMFDHPTIHALAQAVARIRGE